MRVIMQEADFPQNTPIFLYGAGQAGVTVLKAAKKLPGVQIVGFIDTYKKGETLEGLPVSDLDGALTGRDDKPAIIIASAYFADIARQLRLAKVGNYYNGYPFYQTLMDRRLLRKGYFLWALLLGALAAGLIGLFG